MHGDAEQDTRPSPDQRVLPHFGIMASDPTSSTATVFFIHARAAVCAAWHHLWSGVHVLSDVAIR